ncbi:cellular tumor antigen p53 [Anabrus simplex]|uniref:cellular tumor antigen p53 n=1 Tax=Anabrus simplex TaxID=316456 RepID=UPI0034DD79D7
MQSISTVPVPSSTCKVPCLNDYPGPFNFQFEIPPESSDGSKLLFSVPLNKLFVNMHTKIPVKFKWICMEQDLQIRALPVFTSSDNFENPVVRCPLHSSPGELSNEGFNYLFHIIRSDHEQTQYHEDPESHRLSVVVPVSALPLGSDCMTVDFTFTCKNSCPVGMNRRSTAVIFTLEKRNGEVIGRRIMQVRVCSCPKRDKEKEERDLHAKVQRDVQRNGEFELHQAQPLKKLLTDKAHNSPRRRRIIENTDDKTVTDEEGTDNTEVHAGETENEEESDESISREPDVNCSKHLRVRRDSFLLPPNKRLNIATDEESSNSAITIMKHMVDLASSRDEFVVFGEHVARKLRNIKNAKVRLLLQHKISNLLFEGEMTNFGSHL